MFNRKPADLIVLVADKNMEAAISEILKRNYSFGIQALNFKVLVHSHRDPGCRLESHLILAPYTETYKYAIVMFDKEGCGTDELERSRIEEGVEIKLASFGWQNRSIALVLDPELEVWVWSDSPHVEVALGWNSTLISLKQWLSDKNYLHQGASTPNKPKEAMEEVLRLVRKPRSSSIYSELASKVSLIGCTDPTFCKLRLTLIKWFSESQL